MSITNNKSQEADDKFVVIRDYLKARYAIIWKGLQVPESLVRLDRQMGRRFSECLEIIDRQLSDRDFDLAAQAVWSRVQTDLRFVETIGRVQLELGCRPILGFNEQLRWNLFLEKQFKPAIRCNPKFAQIFESPILSFFTRTESVICQLRFWRRYLRSRFGLNEKSLQKIAFEQTKATTWDHSFYSWLNRQVSLDGSISENERDELLSRWRAKTLYDSAILEYAITRLINCELEFLTWQAGTIFGFHAFFPIKDNQTTFDLENGVSHIVKSVEPILKEFRLILLSAEMELRREYGLSEEEPLASLSAWAASSLNLTVNQRAARALQVDSKPLIDSLCERVPANVMIALQEEDAPRQFMSGRGKRSILSRVAAMIEEEMPLEARHEQRRQSLARRGATQDECARPESDFGLPTRAVSPEELSTGGIDDFASREEARLDARRRLALAKLSAREGEVFQLYLQGYSEEETAFQLHISAGAVSSLKVRAKKKLRHAC